MLTVIVIAAAFVICCLAGLYAVQAVADDVPPPTRLKKGVVFVLGFAGWPLAIIALVVVILVFWDLLWMPDIDDLAQESAPRRDP